MSRQVANLNRRMLLAGLAAGAVGAAAAAAPIVVNLRLTGGSAGRPPSWWDRPSLSLQAAGLAEWTGVVGETFTLETRGGSHALRVAAVNPFAKSGPRPTSLGRSEAFAVVFETVAGAPPLAAADGLYRLTHPSYPALPIFMGAPVAAGRTARLIAVFN
jgi:hypothetical protein